MFEYTYQYSRLSWDGALIGAIPTIVVVRAQDLNTARERADMAFALDERTISYATDLLEIKQLW